MIAQNPAEIQLELHSLSMSHEIMITISGCLVEFEKDIAGDIVDACIENGLLVNKLKANMIRLIPPLILTEKEADEALGILDKVLGGMK